MLMSNADLDFRVTKDIDIVLILEALNVDFYRAFWNYVELANYEHRNKSTGSPQFFRFSHPKSDEFPMMIELFTRRTDNIELPDTARLTPLPIDEDVSSLSAILLDDDYYDFLKYGTVQVDGLSILDAVHLIPFKAKAWLDLSKKRSDGEIIDKRAIKKHCNDLFRLSVLLNSEEEPLVFFPDTIRNDMLAFIEKMKTEEIDLKQLGLRQTKKSILLDRLKAIYTASPEMIQRNTNRIDLDFTL